MSSNSVISVRGIGKTFRIASTQHRATTLAELVAQRLRKPFTRRERETEFDALNDISFEVHRGEVLGIVGRNGAGKSTLLKILSQITPPTRGEIDLHGRVGSLLEVGTGFHPELTGRENIYLNGAILGMSRRDIDREFDSIVAFAETEKFLEVPVKRYSSGMYVRLAFSVAAHLRPDILIVDEVLAVGDLAFQRKCLGKMDEVAHHSGATVLFVSHQMAAVRSLCSRALLIEKGQLIEDGPVDDVLARYLTLNSSAQTATTALPDGEMEAPARAIAVHVSGIDGKARTTFQLGEPWRARVEFELKRPLPHVIAGFGLQNIDGSPIITWWSAPRNLAPGRYTAEFECDVPLAASEVTFAVGLTSDEKSIYYAEGVGALSITEIATGPQPHRASGCGILFTLERPEIKAA
jgi:lipopolysaccharide transport system ATP-binding protein